MTFLNPLNVFSTARRKLGDDPSAGFDPSTTGDPLSPQTGIPSFGYGDSHVAHPLDNGARQRHPIGFAPPEDDATHTRYRTEISFKRHHEMPRASATPELPNEQPLRAWPTADATVGGHDDAQHSLSAEPDAPALEPSGATEAPVAEESVPFYKREISFRRKRNDDDAVAKTVPHAPVDDHAVTAETPAVVDEPVAVESVDAVTEAVDAREEPTSVRDETAGDIELVAVAELTGAPAPDEIDVVVDPPAADTSAEVSEPIAVIEEIAPAVVLVEEERDDPRSESESVVAETASAAVSSADDGPAQDIDSASTAADESAPKSRFSRKAGSAKAEKTKKRKSSRGDRDRIVGLKIGASQLAAAVVTETDAGHELLSIARRPLELGIVVDGEVRDRDALSNALRSFFDDEALPKRDVRIGLASNRIALRTFDIAGIQDEAQFDNAVRFKAHEVLPVAVHESVLDYRVLGEHMNEAGEVARRVLLVVAPRDQVEPYIDVARQAGLGLAGIDLEALGLLRAFVAPSAFMARDVNDTATVVVALGHESSTLVVAAGGVCEFTRVFDWGGGDLQEAIATELDVPSAEAATILRHLSLSGPGRRLESLDDGARSRAVEAVRNRLTPFARELVSSLQFYQTQPDSLGIGGILITGGTSHLEGLGQALHQMVGVNVTVGDPLARVVPREGLDPTIETTLGSLAVPIGLAINDLVMRSVNLLPKGAVKKRNNRSTLIAVGAPIAAVVPIVALGALYMGAHGTASSRQASLDQVQAQIAALPKPTGPTIDASLSGTEAARAVGVANVLGGRIVWEQMFRDVARVLPENVWLKAMTATAPAEVTPANAATSATAAGATASAAPVPTNVTITGATNTQTDVARLIARLATLPSLSNVALVSATTQKAQDQKPTVQFEIVASLSTTGGAS